MIYEKESFAHSLINIPIPVDFLLSFTKDEDYYLSQPFMPSLERFFVPKPFISTGRNREEIFESKFDGETDSDVATGVALLFVQFRLTALKKEKVDLVVESIEPLLDMFYFIGWPGPV